MIIKRTAKEGKRITVYGRTYVIPGHREIPSGEQRTVWIDDDWAIKEDKPELWLYEDNTIPVYYPTKYDYYRTASLEKQERQK